MEGVSERRERPMRLGLQPTRSKFDPHACEMSFDTYRMPGSNICFCLECERSVNPDDLGRVTCGAGGDHTKRNQVCGGVNLWEWKLEKNLWTIQVDHDHCHSNETRILTAYFLRLRESGLDERTTTTKWPSITLQRRRSACIAHPTLDDCLSD